MNRKNYKKVGILITVFVLMSLVVSFFAVGAFSGSGDTDYSGDYTPPNPNRVFAEAFTKGVRDLLNDKEDHTAYGYGPEWTVESALGAIDEHIEQKDEYDSRTDFVEKKGFEVTPYFESHFPEFKQIMAEAGALYVNQKEIKVECPKNCDVEEQDCDFDSLGPEWTPEDVITRIECVEDYDYVSYYGSAMRKSQDEEPNLDNLVRAVMLGDYFEEKYTEYIIDEYNEIEYDPEGFGPDWDYDEYQNFLDDYDTTVFERYAYFLVYVEEGGDDERVHKILDDVENNIVRGMT